jgi:hypothetical protein
MRKMDRTISCIILTFCGFSGEVIGIYSIVIGIYSILAGDTISSIVCLPIGLLMIIFSGYCWLNIRTEKQDMEDRHE